MQLADAASSAQELGRADGPGAGGHGPRRGDVAARRRAARRGARTSTGASRERMNGDEPLGARRRDAAPCRSSPTSTSSSRRSARTTPAPASRTSTRRRCGARSAAARSTTCASCAGSSASSRRRATSPARARGSSSPPRRSAGSGQTALRRVFADLRRRPGAATTTCTTRARPASSPARAGSGSSATSSRSTSCARSRNAVLPAGSPAVGPPVRLAVDDFEVAETERRTSAAVCLLVDLSYSMVLRDTLGSGEGDRARAARAGHAAVPAGRLQVIGFSTYARVARSRPSSPASTPTRCRAPTCSTR